MVQLRTKLTLQLDLGQDSLLVCDLGPLVDGENQRIAFLGAERTFTSHGPLVL